MHRLESATGSVARIGVTLPEWKAWFRVPVNHTRAKVRNRLASRRHRRVPQRAHNGTISKVLYGTGLWLPQSPGQDNRHLGIGPSLVRDDSAAADCSFTIPLRSAGFSVTTPCTDPTETPSTFAITRTDSPLSRFAKMAARLSALIMRGRPPTLPRFRAT